MFVRHLRTGNQCNCGGFVFESSVSSLLSNMTSAVTKSPLKSTVTAQSIKQPEGPWFAKEREESGNQAVIMSMTLVIVVLATVLFGFVLSAPVTGTEIKYVYMNQTVMPGPKPVMQTTSTTTTKKTEPANETTQPTTTLSPNVSDSSLTTEGNVNATSMDKDLSLPMSSQPIEGPADDTMTTKSDCLEFGVDYNGHGLALNNGMLEKTDTPEDCIELCQSNHQCQAMSWCGLSHPNPDHRRACWLLKDIIGSGHYPNIVSALMENCHSFSDISKTTPIVTESTTTTLKSTTVTDKDPDDCFQYNTDFNHQYINLNHGPDHKVDSATECLALCLELDDCEGFTWSGTEMQDSHYHGACWLKKDLYGTSYVAGAVSAKVDECFVLDFATTTLTTGSGCWQYDTDFTAEGYVGLNNGIMEPEESAQDCLAKCQAHAECQGISWVLPGFYLTTHEKSCWLKKNIFGSIPLENVISALLADCN